MNVRYSEAQEREFAAFTDKLAGMDDAALFKSCKDMIWLSAYASNNPRSNYHRMVDALYDECQRRDKGEVYNRAYKAVLESVS